MRIKKLDNEIKDHKEEALRRKKAGDQRGALNFLKRAKMKDTEVNKLEGQ